MADPSPPDEPALPVSNLPSESEIEGAAPAPEEPPVSERALPVINLPSESVIQGAGTATEEPPVSPTTIVNRFFSRFTENDSDEGDEQRDQMMSRFLLLAMDSYLRNHGDAAQFLIEDFPNLREVILNRAAQLTDAAASGVSGAALMASSGGGQLSRDDQLMEDLIRECEADFLENIQGEIDGMDLDVANNSNISGGGAGSSGGAAGGQSSTAARENENQQGNTTEEDSDTQVAAGASTAPQENAHHQDTIEEDSDD